MNKRDMELLLPDAPPALVQTVANMGKVAGPYDHSWVRIKQKHKGARVLAGCPCNGQLFTLPLVLCAGEMYLYLHQCPDCATIYWCLS